jgi:hypothetical protein
MGARSQVGTGLSYQPSTGIDSLESIPGPHKSLKIPSLFIREPSLVACTRIGLVWLYRSILRGEGVMFSCLILKLSDTAPASIAGTYLVLRANPCRRKKIIRFLCRLC